MGQSLGKPKSATPRSHEDARESFRATHKMHRPSARLADKLQAKPRIAYPAQAMKRVQMLSYRPDDPAAIVGSYSFRSQRYPADIDTMNTVEDLLVEGEWHVAIEAEAPQLVAQFVHRLQAIVGQVASSRNTFYLEVKAGYDWDAVDCLAPIGDMHDGVFAPSPGLRASVAWAKGRGCITNEAYAKIMAALAKGATLGATAYDLITTELRRCYVLRWAADEIIAGKKLRGVGKGMPLTLAVHNPRRPPTLVKIDVISKVRGVFLEMSNIYILREILPNGAHKYITSQPSIEGVTLDVEKMLFSPMWYSPFKAIKRMFVYARACYLAGSLTSDGRLGWFLEEALRLLGSDAAIFYQIKSELETLVKMLQDFPTAIDAPSGGHPPVYYAMASQVDGMKARLANTSLPERTVIELSSGLDSALHASHSEAAAILEEIGKFLSGIVKEVAVGWLAQHGLEPPSERLDPFLPSAWYVAELNAAHSPADPLLARQHRNTYDWSIRGAPVAAGAYNLMGGGRELEVSPDADARSRLAGLLLRAQV